MSEYTACPIWGTLASIEPLTSDGVTVDSPRAGGRYLITGRATGTLKSHDENLKVRLTAWLIEQHRLGVDCPEILVLIYLTTSRSVPQEFMCGNNRPLHELGLFKRGIPLLGPGRNIETFLANAIEMYQEPQQEPLEVTAEYEDATGRKFEETFLG